jgi:hypothetical protein
MSTPVYNLPSPIPDAWTATQEAASHFTKLLWMQVRAQKAVDSYLNGKRRGLSEGALDKRWRTVKHTRAMFEGALARLTDLTGVSADPSALGGTHV